MRGQIQLYVVLNAQHDAELHNELQLLLQAIIIVRCARCKLHERAFGSGGRRPVSHRRTPNAAVCFVQGSAHAPDGRMF